MKAAKFKSVDEYIENFPPGTQARLKKIRQTVKSVAPAAKEKISYNMPAYDLHGNLVYFGGFTNHISLFPHPKAIEFFSNDLKQFETSKGTIKFSNDQALPLALIKKIVSFRVKENLARNKKKK